MAIPVSASINQLNAEVFIQEGYELSLDAIVPSIELTGSFSPTTSKTQFYIYSYSKTILYENLNYNNVNGSYLEPAVGTTTSTSDNIYNQFELNPTEDIYNQGYSSGNYYAVYNFIDYELGSELIPVEESQTPNQYEGHPYFLKEISGDRTELRIQNNFLSIPQIESYYTQFTNKINARENTDEFYISFGNNRNFIGINTQLELPLSGSTSSTSILIKLYKPLPSEFKIDQELQIISKVGESQVFSVDFQPNLEFIDNLLQLKGPNYNIDLKDRVNNSTNYKDYNDLINTVSSQSYYQFNSLRDQKGVVLRKNWGDWKQFIKYSSAEQRLNNFYDKMTSIESYEAETLNLSTITGGTTGSIDYSSSYNAASNNINQIISKFDSYEYFLYYITGSESWPKMSSIYPYQNYSVSSSAVQNWFGSTNENSAYYNSGKNQIYSASRYDNSNQDYLYYLIPPFITENSDNDRYVKFVNMIGQSFDEMYLYTEAVEQVRNTNQTLTGSVLPLGLADDVIESLGWETGGNSFNTAGYNPNQIGTFPATGSGLEYINRYIDIASGSVINYYDQDQSTLGYVIALADPSFPYPLDNSSQEIYKRIFHNMVSLVKRKGTVTGLRQLINIWGVPSTMLRISEFGGKNKDDENDYDLWMNRYSTAYTTWDNAIDTYGPTSSVLIPWQPLTANYYDGSTYTGGGGEIAVPDCIQFRFKASKGDTEMSTANFSQSLLVKGDLYDSTADFGITLAYSGSQSGSWSGSVIPTDYQYGDLTFHISGSIADGGIASSDPISLPFFNDGWWSVQLQRLTHISQSKQNSTDINYELKVANNIYDGYDGNEIGFQGSASITMPGGNISSSINEAWNDIHGSTSFNNAKKGVNAVALGGMMGSSFNGANMNIGSGANASAPSLYDRVNVGSGFSGSFQEFRFYRRALTGSQFNDYVMNPESIQGHADSNTGAGSSYDLLSFRLPLGNELEYTDVSGSATLSTFTNIDGGAVSALTFGGTTAKGAFGSLHPSLVNKKGSLYTSSFITTTHLTSSQYFLTYQGAPGDATISASFIIPNTEINYMDQPAAGLRNRIKNKIQVIDKNEYGTILSPLISIQQNPEQSGSYTEDINSLEVGFSFQNEINDDIIATFGHGVVSDAIADPRFISESSDRYPELTRIAEDYFKKYQGVTITDPTYNGGKPTIIEKEYDYNRLIKFYETSLFKAIKNYVPARTSLSTGIIVKQHLLERNKTSATVGITIDTPIAKTPETGSNNGVIQSNPNDKYYSTGFNSGVFQENLLITSSIEMYSLTGSAGGSVNKYNITEALSASFRAATPFTQPPLYNQDMTASFWNDPTPSTRVEENIFIVSDGLWGAYPGQHLIGTSVRIEIAPRINIQAVGFFSIQNIEVSVHSTKRGFLGKNSVLQNFSDVDIYLPSFIFSPDEYIYFTYQSLNPTLSTSRLTFCINTNKASIPNHRMGPSSSLSQQAWWYIDDFTGGNKLQTTQDEFYNGEYSGSNVNVISPQYNPYRIQDNNGAYFSPNDGFTITPTSSFLFQNSTYNPIINNVSGSRFNERFFDMDFDPVSSGSNFIENIPNDYSLLVSASQLGFESTPTADALLEYAEVPESNYTILSSANPRYKGCLLQGADYNFYTGIPSESKASNELLFKGRANTPTLFDANKVRYANNETGSWRGDISYGKEPVISRYPKYFAHFKSSLLSRETFDTTTFNIDQLIEIPYNDITGEQSPKISSSLINGNNQSLIPVSSTFMPGRKLAVSYNNSSKNFTFNANSPYHDTSSLTINYTDLNVGTQEIYASAVEFQSSMTNQLNESNLTTTHSFNNPSWYRPITKGSGIPNSTNHQTGSFTEFIIYEAFPANGVFFDPLNVWNATNVYQGFYNKIQSSGSLVGQYPLKASNLVQGGNNVTLGISTFRPQLGGQIINFQPPWAFLTQSNGPMNADGNNKGYGLLEIGGTHGTIQGVGQWNYFKYTSTAPITSSTFNLIGQHLNLMNTINHNIKNGDVIPNGDYEPTFAYSNAGILMSSLPLAASAVTMKDSLTGSIKSPYPLPTLTDEERSLDTSYFSLNYLNSYMEEYKDFSKPFIIEKGDEIRITYTVPQEVILDDGSVYSADQSLTQRNITQDFTVMGYRLPAPALSYPSPSVTHQDGTPGIPANGNICLMTSSTLASEGVYSQKDLYERYLSMLNNNIPILGSSQEGLTFPATFGVPNCFSGSLESVSKIEDDKVAISFEVHGSPSVQALSTTSSFLVCTTNNMVRTGLAAPLYINELSASMGPIAQMQLRDPGAFLAALGLIRMTDPAFVYGMLEVRPDPSKLEIPIPNGMINAYTVRKRVPADDRVVVNLNQPSGSRGQITPSGDGYLIPNDLTPIQQGNVQKLINKLKSENVFTRDSDNNTVR